MKKTPGRISDIKAGYDNILYIERFWECKGLPALREVLLIGISDKARYNIEGK